MGSTRRKQFLKIFKHISTTKYFFLYCSPNNKKLIAGIGTDIIEVDRIKKQLSEHSGLKEDLFTSCEINYCESKINKAQHYAARFAAKEAFLKALGTGLINGMRFTDIEIQNDEAGKPCIQLYGKVLEYYHQHNISSIHLSISHIGSIANAIVLTEKQPN